MYKQNLPNFWSTVITYKNGFKQGGGARFNPQKLHTRNSFEGPGESLPTITNADGENEDEIQTHSASDKASTVKPIIEESPIKH